MGRFKKIMLDPIELVNEMFLKNEKFDSFDWAERDAQILEIAARLIREGHERRKEGKKCD